VLKPGGRAVVIDRRKDASKKDLDAYVDGLKTNFLSAFLIKRTFRLMLLRPACTKSQFHSVHLRKWLREL
jgi:hypothetical protein